MKTRLWQGVLLVGLGLAVLALVADPLGVGAAPGFGWRQRVSLVVGLALAALAGWQLRQPGS